MTNKGYSSFWSAQDRSRTGTPEGTGVWDQRVYQFRHLGKGYWINQ